MKILGTRNTILKMARNSLGTEITSLKEAGIVWNLEILV